jgi:hypothetical protein
MKNILFFLLFISIANLNAKVGSQLTKTQSSFNIHSDGEDHDVENLFNSIRGLGVKNGQNLEKKVEIKSGNERVFFIHCSVLASNTLSGNCKIIIYKSSFSEMNLKEGFVYLDIAGGISRKVGERFIFKESGEIFTSNDGSLAIRANLSINNATDFYITFNEAK